MVDISPRYAGILLGIVNTFCAVPGFISPIIVSYLTYQNQTTESWRYIFFITAGLLILSGVIYIFFADNEMQEWNSGKKSKSRETKANENEFIKLTSTNSMLNEDIIL